MKRNFRNERGAFFSGDIIIDTVLFFIVLITVQVFSFKYKVIDIPAYAWVLFDIILLIIAVFFAREIFQEFKRANNTDAIKARSENPRLKYVGETAQVIETLRPAGKIQLNTFHGNTIYDARATQLKDIPQGTRIKIVGFELHEFLVRPLSEEEMNLEEFVTDELGVTQTDNTPVYTRKCTVYMLSGDKLTGFFETDEILISTEFSPEKISVHKKNLHHIELVKEGKFKIETRDKNTFNGSLHTDKINIKNDHGSFDVPVTKIQKVEFLT